LQERSEGVQVREGELGEVIEQVRPLLIEAARVKGVKGGGGEFGQGPPARPGLLGGQLGAQERPAVGATTGPDPAGGCLGLPAASAASASSSMSVVLTRRRVSPAVRPVMLSWTLRSSC